MWLASIIDASDDAIISKNLGGIITSWNKGAEQLFGYFANEVIGKSITILAPPERRGEDYAILESVRRGDRVAHYETVRQRKDGSPIDVSLTISPIRGAAGEIVGASKIARDITERKRIEAQVSVLAREAEHRAKNVLANVGAIVQLSRADSTGWPEESDRGTHRCACQRPFVVRPVALDRSRPRHSAEAGVVALFPRKGDTHAN
jgi:PAS domain S-box-containing protein